MRLKRNMYSSQGSKRGISDMTAAAVWSLADDKLFEDALVNFPDGVPNRWQMIAGCLPGKTALDVMVHYETLLFDVGQIEAGLVEFPNYPELTQAGRSSGKPPLPPTAAGNRKQRGRKKGKAWTVEEHMLFLRGLEIYGKSDWRSISRNVVGSRVPSQVASHAQKYFNRRKSAKKDRKRSSIHDITKPSDCMPNLEQPQPQPPSTHAVDCFTAINNANAAMDSNAGMACLTGINTANAGMDCLTGINNANAAMDSNAGMACLTGINTANAGMDCLTGINNANAAMDSNAGMACLTGINTANAGMDCLTGINNANAAIGCYINNSSNSNYIDCYINNDTMSVGVDCYLNNNNTHMSAGMNCCIDSMSALDCLSLPESSNTTNAMTVSAPANADFQTHYLLSDAPYSEMDFRFQESPVQHK